MSRRRHEPGQALLAFSDGAGPSAAAAASVPAAPPPRLPPAPAPPIAARPSGLSEADLDSVVFDAMTYLDGSLRRWAMRRASGQSSRDLKAACIYEMFEVPSGFQLLRDRYDVGGCRVLPYLAIREGIGGPSVRELDLDQIVVRARRPLSIPMRGDDPAATVATVQAGSTGVIFYAHETGDGYEELLEPGQVGSADVRHGAMPAKKLHWIDEIRHLPDNTGGIR